MRQPLIIQGAPSPLAKTFSQFAQQMASGPTADELAYKQAATNKLMMDAQKTAGQQQAMGGVGSSLADLMGQFTAAGQPVRPWTNPDNGEVIQNTQPSAPLATPEQATTLRSTGLADLFSRVGKENADALKSGLEVGQAYGTPDEMRRSMIIGGHSVDQNFSPTGEEGNRVAKRNNDLTQNREIAVNNAKPDKMANVTPRNYITPDSKQGYTLDNMTDAQTGGPIPQGSQLFTGQVQAANSGGLMPTVRADMQKKNLAINDTSKFLDAYEELVNGKLTKDPVTGADRREGGLPDSAFGLAGTGQLLAGDAAIQAKNVGGLLSALGYKVDPQNGQDPVTQATAQARADMLKNGVSRELVDQLFGGAQKLHSLETFHNLGLYKIAAAAANQEGRGVTDGDIKRIQNAMPDPLGAGGSKGRTLQAIGDVRNIMGITQQAMGMPGATGAPATSAPAASASADQSISNARAAIAQGISREHVLQRLRQNGITPPPDL